VGPIALLGGSGFVGSRTAAALAGVPAEVRLLTRQVSRAAALRVLPGLTAVGVDPADPARLAAALSGCTAAVNFVGILNETGRDGRGFDTAHVELTRRLVAACQTAGVNRIVQVSALNAGHPATRSHYLRSKGAAEAVIRSSGLAWTIVQPSVIFGPGDSFLNRFGDLLRLVPFVLPLAMPDARFAPVHVDDVAAALTAILARPGTAGQVYQLCGPDTFSLRELVQLTARTLGLRRAVLGLPVSIARLQAAVMDFVPGKPFSTDNFESLQLPSVCTSDGFAALGLPRRSLAAHVGVALGVAGPLRDYDRFRRSAGR
jgi:NADH dehydrogenase